MPKRDYIDFQDRSTAVAYLITFRCYGTWLHGDDRGSMDRRFHNRYGAPKIAPNTEMVASRERLLKSAPFLLGPREREVVDAAIRETCRFREYLLHARNVRTNHAHVVVRTNHAHVVVGNAGSPERIMNAFKANATRALRSAGLLGQEDKAWSRHGSTKYLWTEADVTDAVAYVLHSQGDELIGNS